MVLKQGCANIRLPLIIYDWPKSVLTSPSGEIATVAATRSERPRSTRELCGQTRMLDIAGRTRTRRTDIAECTQACAAQAYVHPHTHTVRETEPCSSIQRSSPAARAGMEPAFAAAMRGRFIPSNANGSPALEPASCTNGAIRGRPNACQPPLAYRALVRPAASFSTDPVPVGSEPSEPSSSHTWVVLFPLRPGSFAVGPGCSSSSAARPRPPTRRPWISVSVQYWLRPRSAAV